ncbi:4'-phosphopantetheinyl transferase superfamily protein [Mycoplasma sp. 527]
MISIDMAKINRFINISTNAIKKILHPIEIEEYLKISDSKKPIFLATRWALKECIFKIDNSIFSFKNILIKKTNAGRYTYANYQLSTTSEDGYIVAVAFKS